MEISGSKALFLKAGIPLALSAAALIYAKFLSKRTILSADQDPSSLESIDDEEERGLGLRSRIEELQKRELEMENKFLEFLAMKEQESMLMEFKNMLAMESAHVEFLGKEISSMEAENQRFQNLVVEFLKLVEKLEFKKLQNGALGRKIKKLSRKMKDQSRSIREKSLKIDAAEEEIMRCCNVNKKLEDQVQELQRLINTLEEEKNELLIKLNAHQSLASAITKIDEEGVTMDEYSKVVQELEQLHKDEATEIAELTYLKWSNACLRHELMKNHEQEKINGNGEIRDCKLNDNQGNSRRKKLLQKIKEWVERNEHLKPTKLEEKEKQEINGFHRLSVDHIIPARRSCSSA